MKVKYAKFSLVKIITLVFCGFMAGLTTLASANNPIEQLMESPDHAQPVYIAKGKGTYLLSGFVEIDFRFLGIQQPNGRAFGKFSQSLIFQEQLIDFTAKITCLAFDRENGRVWFGGVVLYNNSEHPGFTGDIHQPGKDVWFRALDTGKHSEEADRTTFLGFEGAGGIITSQEYCDAQIWPGPPDDEENARTHPVIEGYIHTLPRKWRH